MSPAPGKREEAAARALAEQIAKLLEPVLLEMDRKLDRIDRRLDDLLAVLARWEASTAGGLPARLEAAPGRASYDATGEGEACQPSQER